MSTPLNKNIIYLLTGSNIGDRLQYLLAAEQLIKSQIGTIIKKSNVYETEAWGDIPQDAFLNRIIEVSTTLQASYLLKRLKKIESYMGRTTKGDYKPRVIDIDIIYYNETVIEKSNLKIPHPHMEKRRFVLTPLNEIAPLKIHPILHMNTNELLKHCVDTLKVYIFAGSEV